MNLKVCYNLAEFGHNNNKALSDCYKITSLVMLFLCNIYKIIMDICDCLRLTLIGFEVII